MFIHLNKTLHTLVNLNSFSKYFSTPSVTSMCTQAKQRVNIALATSQLPKSKKIATNTRIVQ